LKHKKSSLLNLKWVKRSIIKFLIDRSWLTMESETQSCTLVENEVKGSDFFPQRCKAFRSKVWPCFLWTWGSLDGKIIDQGSPRNKELIDKTITGLVATARNYFRACSNPMLSVISTGQKWMTSRITTGQNYCNNIFWPVIYINAIYKMKNLPIEEPIMLQMIIT
jgi:hypothetical protein